MVRLFNVYYPTRILLLVGAEAGIVSTSFILAVIITAGADSTLVLAYESGFYKILGITALALALLYYADLYDPQRIPNRSELYSRLLVVLGTLSLLLGVITYLAPTFALAQGVFLRGFVLVALGLFAWRVAYFWLIRWPFLRERVYVIGSGPRAKRIVETMRTRPELGMDVVGWKEQDETPSASEKTAKGSLADQAIQLKIERAIVALADRRGKMPVQDLLKLRLTGVKVEDGINLLEKISGKVEVDEIYPSWLVFSEGFRLNPGSLAVRRIVSFLVSLACLLLCLPLMPFIALAIVLTSAGPVFYRQLRIGRNSIPFTCYKFRTMRQDAELETGPKWAGDNDPRVTLVGRFLRSSRLDEIPQLWNVLRGDMGFVGPRPERPEFVEWLSNEIPYYHLRHIIRPGITGWAQIQYEYGASLEQAKEKLKYDLYYVKRMSLSLDIWIILQTFKIVLLGRGAR